MELKKGSLKVGLSKFAAKASEKAAQANVNSACVWWLHQPQPPKAALKLKKVK